MQFSLSLFLKVSTVSKNRVGYDITFCNHNGCYETCEYNILNVEDKIRDISVSDRYGEGCPLYEYTKHMEELDE